jgi:hypothetical protein
MTKRPQLHLTAVTNFQLSSDDDYDSMKHSSLYRVHSIAVFVVAVVVAGPSSRYALPLDVVVVSDCFNKSKI